MVSYSFTVLFSAYQKTNKSRLSFYNRIGKAGLMCFNIKLILLVFPQ